MNSLTTDPLFDNNRTEEYKLSIQVSLDGFSFSVVQVSENTLLACDFFPVTVSSEKFLGKRFAEWVKSREILQKKFKETCLCYFSQKFTLIPSKIYDFQKQNHVANLNFGEQQEIGVRDNYLPDIQGNLVFTIPNSLLESFQQIFPGQLIVHPIALFHRAIQEKYGNENSGQLLALLFQKKSFSLLLFKQGNLLQVNHFKFNHQNDVFYYVLSTLKSLKSGRSNASLVLAGNVKPNDDIHTLLSAQFGNIDFYQTPCKHNDAIFKAHLHLLTPLI